MGKTITKGEFVKALAEKTGMNLNKANETLNTILDSITDELKVGNSVLFTGFGKFKVVARAERQGRNPSTKESITIPASKAPVFHAGKSLKGAIN